MRCFVSSSLIGLRGSIRPTAFAAALLLSLAGVIGNASAGPVVTSTQHKALGFEAHYPFSESRSDSKDLCPFVPPGLPAGLSYSVGVTGSASVLVNTGTDLTFSYDKADVVAGGILPLHITYAPTSGSVIHVSVPISIHVEGCIKDCFLPDLCDGITVPCAFEAGPASFTPPLTGDAPVTIPISSCTISLNIAGVVDVGNAHVEGSVTLAPVPAGGLALGGAIGGYGVTGPASTSGVPLLEWDTAGQTQTAGLQLNNPLPPSADVNFNLKPVLHWLATSADIRLVIHLGSVFHDVGIDDPSPISLFAGNLGPLYTAVGLDTQVHDAVVAAVGFDPGFGPAIAAGKVPIPLLDPELQSLSSGVTPVLGTATFKFSTDVTPPTTLSFLTPAPTVFGWNNTSVDVTLSAADSPGGSGVKQVTYSGSGAQFIPTTTVPGNVAVVHVTAPGITTLSFHATDNQDNAEADKTVDVRIDETSPLIVINQPAATNYTHSATLTLDYVVTDAGGSGLNTVIPRMDGSTTLAGHGLASGQAIPLLTEMLLGSHAFSIAADDRAANLSNASVTFTIIVTAASIKEDVVQLIAGGDILKSKLKNSLLAKLSAAEAAIGRGNCTAATNIYQAFINDVSAQSGKGIDLVAAGILITDAHYLIDHCATLIAANTLSNPPGGGGGGSNAPGETGNPLDAQSGSAYGEAGAGNGTPWGGRAAPMMAWPSPYRGGSLSIAYATSDEMAVARDGDDVRIYDLAGRLVRSMASALWSSGYRLATWDGIDARGGRVSGGMYFVRAGSPGREKLLRLAVIR